MLNYKSLNGLFCSYFSSFVTSSFFLSCFVVLSLAYKELRVTPEKQTLTNLKKSMTSIQSEVPEKNANPQTGDSQVHIQNDYS